MTGWVRWRVAVIDRLAAAALAVVLAPVVLAVAAWVRCSDGAPVLVALPRVGRSGDRFPMWKFRTMDVARSDGRAGGPAITATGDRRVTVTGARLRRHRLDELPQLWNVLRGDMGLVGPRPETPELVDVDDPRWAAVLAVPPGVTGPTQLLVHRWEADALGAGDPEAAYREVILPVKLAVDRWYVERATLGLDLLVARSMVQHLLAGRAVTAVERRIRREVPAAVAVPASTPPTGSPRPGLAGTP